MNPHATQPSPLTPTQALEQAIEWIVESDGHSYCASEKWAADGGAPCDCGFDAMVDRLRDAIDAARAGVRDPEEPRPDEALLRKALGSPDEESLSIAYQAGYAAALRNPAAARAGVRDPEAYAAGRLAGYEDAVDTGAAATIRNAFRREIIENATAIETTEEVQWLADWLGPPEPVPALLGAGVREPEEPRPDDNAECWRCGITYAAHVGVSHGEWQPRPAPDLSTALREATTVRVSNDQIKDALRVARPGTAAEAMVCTAAEAFVRVRAALAPKEPREDEHGLYARDPSIPRGWDDPQWCRCGNPWPCPATPADETPKEAQL